MPRPRRVVDPPLSSSSSTLPQSLEGLSLPLSSTTTTTSSSQRRELRVLLYDKPRYTPSSSRSPQPPISLVPPRDDFGAFIVDKVVTPLDWGQEIVAAEDYDTDEEDEKYRQDPQRQTVKRVLNYVVGWPDEPFARQLVPCTQILDYVSPRTLEDWEYALTERQRREREALQEAANAKKKHGKIEHEEEEDTGDITMGDATVPSLSFSSPHSKEAVTQQQLPRRGGPRGRKRKKRGRPAQTAAATAARIAAAAARAAGQLPAATPTKSSTPADPTRMARAGSSLDALSTLSGLQIQLDSATTPSTSLVPSLSSPVSEKQLLLQTAADIIPSLASGKQRTGLSLKRPFQKFVEQQNTVSSSVSVEGDGGERGMSLGIETTTTATTSANEEEGEMEGMDDEMDDEIADIDGEDEDEEEEEDELQRESVLHPAALLPPLRGSPPVQHRQQQQQQPRTTHIPPPSVPLPKQKPPEPRPIPVPLPTVQQSMSSIPADKKKKSAMAPIPPPSHPFHSSLSSIADISGGSASGSNSSSLKQRQNEETLIPTPSMPAHALQQEEVVDEEEEDLYEVDRLEGDCLTVVDEDGNGDMEGLAADARATLGDGKPLPAGATGRLVRFFLVRWKGDWPPDQNPTWEPAENLPPRMVRQYLKKAAQGEPAGARAGTSTKTAGPPSMIK